MSFFAIILFGAIPVKIPCIRNLRISALDVAAININHIVVTIKNDLCSSLAFGLPLIPMHEDASWEVVKDKI